MEESSEDERELMELLESFKKPSKSPTTGTQAAEHVSPSPLTSAASSPTPPITRPTPSRLDLELDLLRGALWMQWTNTVHAALPKLDTTRTADATTAADKDWTLDVKWGEHGLVTYLILRLAEEFCIRLPSPRNFTAFKADPQFPSDDARFPLARDVIMSTGITSVTAFAQKDGSALCDVGALVLLQAVAHEEDIFLDAIARILVTIPAVTVRVLRGGAAAQLDTKPPLWYKHSLPFSQFLTIAFRQYAWTDWTLHPFLLLSALLDDMQSTLAPQRSEKVV